MRVAALYDIHGNLPALEAVIDEVYRAEVDEIVIGGDVFPGPMADDALALLVSLRKPVRFIRGNCDRNLVDVFRAHDSPDVPSVLREVFEWHARRLDADAVSTIAAWPLTLRRDVYGTGPVLFCHATPRDDNEMFNGETPAERILPAFAGVATPLVVCGHTHHQFDRMIGEIRVVNAGSVGMPFRETGADWLLLDGGPQLRRTSYDLTAAAERIRSTSYPRREEFADAYVR
jgi:predicted phosphodiesterase